MIAAVLRFLRNLYAAFALRIDREMQLAEQGAAILDSGREPETDEERRAVDAYWDRVL